MSEVPKTSSPNRALRGLLWAMVIGAAIGLAPGLYSAWFVTTRGCNPFLDQSAHGAPLCQ